MNPNEEMQQEFQDALEALTLQRNNAQNEAAGRLVEIRKLQRRIVELEKQLADAKPKDGEIIAPPKVNGHAEARVSA